MVIVTMSATMKPIIPHTNPAVAIPFGVSLFARMKKMIAIVFKTSPKNGTQHKMSPKIPHTSAATDIPLAFD